MVQLDGYPLPYALVNKPVDQKKQVERTAVCSKANGFDCLHAIPGWTILVAHLKRKFDLPNFEKMLYTVHFLLNDTTCQTSYDWHSDGPDLALSWPDEKRLVGLAVQLGANAPTANASVGLPTHRLWRAWSMCAFLRRLSPQECPVVRCSPTWHVSLQGRALPARG